MVVQPERRRHLAPEPRRPRSAQGVRGLRRGGEDHRPAHRDPGQDGQGLRHGHRGRGAQPHPPDQEAGRRRGARVPRPLPAADQRRSSCATAKCRSTARTRSRRKWSTCASAAPPSAATCRSAGARPASRWRCRRWRPSSACSSPPASARSAPPWRSCRCSTSSCATSRSARAACRSWPTKRAPSAWKACSASSASTPRRARSTSRWTPTS